MILNRAISALEGISHDHREREEGGTSNLADGFVCSGTTELEPSGAINLLTTISPRPHARSSLQPLPLMLRAKFDRPRIHIELWAQPSLFQSLARASRSRTDAGSVCRNRSEGEVGGAGVFY